MRVCWLCGTDSTIRDITGKWGVAWGVATAYAKYPKETHAFLLENHLDDETYNKAIQKMIESYRISAEDKEILRGMKRKLQK